MFPHIASAAGRAVGAPYGDMPVPNNPALSAHLRLFERLTGDPTSMSGTYKCLQQTQARILICQGEDALCRVCTTAQRARIRRGVAAQLDVTSMTLDDAADSAP